jgi:hypothetical protein
MKVSYMNLQMHHQKSTRVVSIMVLGVFLSLVWWYLAMTGNPSTRPDLTISIISVLGGFLPAAVGIWMLKAANISKKMTSCISFWGMLVFISYPGLITILFLTQTFMDHPNVAPAWFYHPGVLTFNLMAVLLIGPIADSLGLKARMSEFLKAEYSAKQGKFILIFCWWVWHLPFIFLNGSALAAMNFPNSLMAAYLVTILGVSWLLSWGYDRERRLVLFTAMKHF